MFVADTTLLAHIYKSLVDLLTDAPVLPVHTGQGMNISGIQSAWYRNYPSFFENHGAKAPYLDYSIKLNSTGQVW
jgi:hypothetical protein